MLHLQPMVKESFKTKIGVIGLGNMGRHHARLYSELKQSELVAVCDIDKTRVEEAEQMYGCKGYTRLEDMLAYEDLDAVSIIAPTFLHFSLAKTVIEQGLHVLIEKPIAATNDEAKELCQLAKTHGVIVCVGHIERFNPAIQALKAKLDTGFLGEIVSIETRRMSPMPQQIKDADVIIDLAVHDIDIVTWLMGEAPQKVQAFNQKKQLKDRFDQADIALQFSQASAKVLVSWLAPTRIRDVRIVGSKGLVELNYLTQKLSCFENETWTDIPLEKKEPLREELLHFLHCIQTQTQAMVNAEVGAEALKWCLEAAHA